MKGLFGNKGEKSFSGQPITSFAGYYQFLSIDFHSKVYFQGFLYPSVTVAFQAARTTDISVRRRISEVEGAEEFKKIIVAINNAEDWNENRVDVMMKLNRDKFKRNKDLGMKLFATQSRELVNGYGGGSDAHGFWGMIQKNGKFEGLNTLGKVLHQIREEMKNGSDFRKWVEDQKVEKDKDMWPEASMVVEKEGSSVDNLMLTDKNIVMLGSHEANDFKLEHGSISKYHAAIYFSTDMQVILVDLNSTNGTKITRAGKQINVDPLRPESLQNRDVISFGMSSRNYQEVEKRMARKEEQIREELQTIQRLKKAEKMVTENEEKSRQEIKSLLQLKRYSCLYVDGVTRAFPYQAMKQIFNRYGPVKNIRISIDKKTGRYMGSALIYYQDGFKINDVLANIVTLGYFPCSFEPRLSSVKRLRTLLLPLKAVREDSRRKKWKQAFLETKETYIEQQIQVQRTPLTQVLKQFKFGYVFERDSRQKGAEVDEEEEMKA